MATGTYCFIAGLRLPLLNHAVFGESYLRKINKSDNKQLPFSFAQDALRFKRSVQLR